MIRHPTEKIRWTLDPKIANKPSWQVDDLAERASGMSLVSDLQISVPDLSNGVLERYNGARERQVISVFHRKGNCQEIFEMK